MNPTLKGTLILTFSLMEKELALGLDNDLMAAQRFQLPLHEGEGWGEGQAD
jgi:hypothetical protein